jgi:putative adenylate-forming enzyme
MSDRLAILRSYLATLRRRHATRGAIELRQYHALQDHPRLGPMVAGSAGLDDALHRLPVRSSAEWRERFADFNRYGIGLDEARRLAADEITGRPNSAFSGVSFGLSTGTSGEPGVFMTTSTERAAFLGAILAKSLPPMKLPGCRIALLLKHNNPLYADVARTHCVRFEFFDLARPIAQWSERFVDFAPDVVVGPPSALLALAATDDFARRPARPHPLMAGAEPLFPSDARRLADAFATQPRSIYQASEGFLALACPHGSLHVNEDILIAEWQRFAGATARAVPVITDFTRTSQDVWRVRLDDVVRLFDQSCPCGSSYRTIAAVEGRLGDVLYGAADDVVAHFPFDVEARIGPLLDPCGEWQIVQPEIDMLQVAVQHPPISEVWRDVCECLSAVGRWTRIVQQQLPPRPLQVKRRRFVRLIDPMSSRLVATLQPPARA